MQELKIPFYIKVTLILTGAIALGFILFVGRDVLLPLVFALFASILLNPLVTLMTRKGLHKLIAISLVVLLAMLFFAGLVAVLFLQVSIFIDTYPPLREKLYEAIISGVQWFASTFDAEDTKVLAWLTSMQARTMQSMSGSWTGVALSVGTTVAALFLMPVYIFLFLLYKPHLLEFIRQLFNEKYHKTVAEILMSVKGIIQRYLMGILFECLIMTVLNSVALFSLGIKYAFLLAITGALLNMIPYIGGVVGAALPITIALVTKSPLIALLVLVAYIVIQLIDNHIIVPYVVASRVKINALVAIIVVIIGGLLWGIAGMFLCLPIVALLKVICDHIEALKPWGYLLGDDSPNVLLLPFPKAKKKA